MNRFAFLLATTAFVTPAMAADVIYEEPAAPAPVVAFEPAFTWTGFYVGGQAGVAFNNDAGPFSSRNNSSFVGGGSDDGDTAFIGGVHVGYDYQINNLIVGAVADINYLDASSVSSFTIPTFGAANSFATFGAVQDINYVGTVRGKVGFAADRLAIYATGGLAYADVENEYFGGNSFRAVNGTLYSVTAEEDSDDLGYAVGAGVDYLVTENFSVGIEYLYTDLGSSDIDVRYTPVAGSPAGAASFDASSNDDLDFHTVWAKASFRFN